MRRGLQAWLGVLLVGALVGLTGSVRAGPAPTTLPNGLKIYVEQDQRAPLVAVDIELAIGKQQDPVAYPGLTQLVGEILKHGSTRHLSSDARRQVARAFGVDPWDVDVTVGPDRTHIAFQVPPRALELALWMASDQLTFIADSIDAASVAAASAAVEQTLTDSDEAALQVVLRDDVVHEHGRRALRAPGGCPDARAGAARGPEALGPQQLRRGRGSYRRGGERGFLRRRGDWSRSTSALYRRRPRQSRSGAEARPSFASTYRSLRIVPPSSWCGRLRHSSLPATPSWT